MIKNEIEFNVPSLQVSDLHTDPEIRTMIEAANCNLQVLGFTEHGIRHVTTVSSTARDLLRDLGYDTRTQELAAIAGLTHDIGNVVSRHGHATIGAMMAHPLLISRGMSAEDSLIVIGAIGSHGDDAAKLGEPVHPVSAALIIADKSDVHRSRVTNPDPTDFDEHEKMNYATTSSRLSVDNDAGTITLELEIDTDLASVMKYFELFMPRMQMCIRAATMLEREFRIRINGVCVL